MKYKRGVLILLILFFVLITACKKINSTSGKGEDDMYVNYVPPVMGATGEILEINGHELVIKVMDVKDTNVYCDVGDTIRGELLRYDFFYEKYPFDVGDIVFVSSNVGTIKDNIIKFDYLKPEGYVLENSEEPLKEPTGYKDCDFQKGALYYNDNLYVYSGELNSLDMNESLVSKHYPKHILVGQINDLTSEVPNKELEAYNIKEGVNVYANPNDNNEVIIYTTKIIILRIVKY